MPSIDIENTRAGYSSITVTVDGTETTAKGINYGDSMARGDVMGNARMSLGVSEGMYTADEATMELYLAEYDTLMDALGENFYTKAFTVTVAFVSDGKTRTDTLVGCRMTKRAADNQSGSADGLTRSLSMKPLYLKINGKNPLPSAQMPKGAK